jgi:threonine/homoserine/homoserine lactone efflux protein
MTSTVLWQGFAVGFLAALPLGPMGMLCVQRTLQRGRLAGVVSAAGLTVAASLWCVVAAQGLSTMAVLVDAQEPLLMIGLGLFLVLAAVAGLRGGACAPDSASRRSTGTLASLFLSSFLGVMFNPVTFVTMTAVLALLGGVQPHLDVQHLAGLAGAALVGGLLVWLFITHSIALVRTRLTPQGGVRLSRALNYCILGLGIIYLVRPFLADSMG